GQRDRILDRPLVRGRVSDLPRLAADLARPARPARRGAGRRRLVAGTPARCRPLPPRGGDEPVQPPRGDLLRQLLAGLHPPRGFRGASLADARRGIPGGGHRVADRDRLARRPGERNPEPVRYPAANGAADRTGDGGLRRAARDRAALASILAILAWR